MSYLAFPGSPALWKTFNKILQKVLVKMLIKSLSKPLIRKVLRLANFTYQSLTAPIKAAKSEPNGDSDNKATEELSVVIDDLLNQLGTKFNTISEELLGKSKLVHGRHSFSELQC